jgi:hypothetical protein
VPTRFTPPPAASTSPAPSEGACAPPRLDDGTEVVGTLQGVDGEDVSLDPGKEGQDGGPTSVGRIEAVLMDVSSSGSE